MSRFFSKILLITSLAILSAASFNAAKAVDATYLIEDVATEADGESPSNARTNAINSGRRSALLVLLERLEIDQSISEYVSNEEIFEMVLSEQIKNEKIAGNHYAANLRIIFSKDFVDHILDQKQDYQEIAQAMETKPQEEVRPQGADEFKDIVIPIKIINYEPVIWQGAEDWRHAILGNIIKNSQNLKIPDADISNISSINKDTIFNASFDSMTPLVNRYNSSNIYILAFFNDPNSNKTFVEVTHIDKNKKEKSKLAFVNGENMTNKDLMNKVAQKTIEYVIGQRSTISKTNTEWVNIVIPVKNLSEWLATKRQIENSNILENINISSLTKNHVFITAHYLGGANDIREIFARIGITLNKQISSGNGNDTFILTK